VLLDLAIHDVDYLRWLFGDVQRVFAREAAEGHHAHATLRFESGVVGYVEASWRHPATDGLRTAVELAGDGGLIEYDSTEATPVRATVDGDPVADLETLERDPFRRELAEFVDCVERGVDPETVTLADAVDSLRVCLAAKRSADRGRPVEVSEVSG
jgi:predicted dehydrogenase